MVGLEKNSNTKKRARSVNFSARETQCLVDEVLKRASVIENKRTDAVTWKQKEDAWTDLTETFNAATASNRTDKMLKVKYDGIKRRIKQKNSRHRAEQFKTGGGVAEVVIFEPWEEKLMQVILLSVEGLPTGDDCDKEKHIGEYVANMNSENQINLVDVEMLEVFVENPIVADGPILVDNPIVVDNPILVDNPIVVDNPIPSTSGILTKEKKDLNWKSWTPASLRTPISKKLKMSTSKQLNNVGNKYSSMANSREDLLTIQKKVAEQQLAEISLRVELLKKDDARKEFESQLRIKMATELHEQEMKLFQLKNTKYVQT